jgi:hypothetical protein
LNHRELLAGGRLTRRHHRAALKGEEIDDIEVTETEVEHSYLWHEDLGAAMEAERVLHETYQLDLQQFCDPQALVYGGKANAAFLEFINLKPGDTQQAIGFIEKFGAFDMIELAVDDPEFFSLPREVQQFCRACLHTNTPGERCQPFATSLDQFWKTQEDIVGLWRLADHLAARKTDAVREECKLRRPTYEFSANPDWLAVGRAVLAADVSASLNMNSPKPPRLLLHARDGQFIPLTLCQTVRSSLYVQLLTAIVSAKEHRRCLHCNGYFIPKVQSQMYCIGKCQNIAKVRRSRAKKGQKQEA